MRLKISILLFLCVAMLLPNIATAQNVFAKQKVVIADVRDVNDCKLDDNMKFMIRQNFVEACSNTNDYEVFEVNMDDIRRQLANSGQTVSFPNICKAIGSKADYIIFIEVMTNTSDRRNPDMMIYITAKLYRIATASMQSTDMESAQPTTQSIMSSIKVLLKKLLGIDVNLHLQQAGSGVGAPTLSFGYVNSQAIITLMPEYNTIQAQLEAFGKDLQEQMGQIQAKFNNKYEEFQRNSGMWSSDHKRIKEQELQDLQQQYADFQSIAQADFQKKQSELFEPVQAKFRRACDAVAKSTNCIIFDDNGTALLSKHGMVDLNDAVKQELGIR